jgi:hypothetical protein
MKDVLSEARSIAYHQIAKDVVSANRAGAKSLLLPRRDSGDDIKVRIFQRPPEAVVRMALGIHFDREG